MRHTTFSLTVIGACATGAATIIALAANAGASPSDRPTSAPHALTQHATSVVHKSVSKRPSPRTHGGSAPSASSPNRLKPQLTGLLNRQGVPPAAYRTAEGGYDIQGTHDDQSIADVGDVSWAELQPTAGGPIAPDNAIDKAITDVRAWNVANPTHPEALKLRVEAGVHSPAWALNLGGTCVSITDPTTGKTGCSPRFWTAQFSAAYYQFEAELAAKYDSVPEIREVDMAKNTTFYNESLIRQVQSPSTIAALEAAGYRTVVDEHQQLEDIITLGADWKDTRVGFAFNPYQTANPVSQDEAFTQELITEGRAALGDQLVLENNSLRQSLTTGRGTYQSMYAFMTQTGGPIGFQTATLSKVGSIQAVLNAAIAMGGSSVELPTGYENQFTPAALMAAGRLLI